MASGQLAKSAVLVQCERIDGRPRQKVIRYLASIREGSEGEPHIQRHFWAKVERGLSSLDLGEHEKENVRMLLQESVPAPVLETFSAFQMKHHIKEALAELEDLHRQYLSAKRLFWDGLEGRFTNKSRATVKAIRALEEARAQELASTQTVDDLMAKRDGAKRAFWDRMERYLGDKRYGEWERTMIRKFLIEKIADVSNMYDFCEGAARVVKRVLGEIGKPARDLLKLPDWRQMLLDLFSG